MNNTDQSNGGEYKPDACYLSACCGAPILVSMTNLDDQECFKCKAKLETTVSVFIPHYVSNARKGEIVRDALRNTSPKPKKTINGAESIHHQGHA